MILKGWIVSQVDSLLNIEHSGSGSHTGYKLRYQRDAPGTGVIFRRVSAALQKALGRGVSRS